MDFLVAFSNSVVISGVRHLAVHGQIRTDDKRVMCRYQRREKIVWLGALSHFILFLGRSKWALLSKIRSSRHAHLIHLNYRLSGVRTNNRITITHTLHMKAVQIISNTESKWSHDGTPGLLPSSWNLRHYIWRKGRSWTVTVRAYWIGGSLSLDSSIPMSLFRDIEKLGALFILKFRETFPLVRGTPLIFLILSLPRVVNFKFPCSLTRNITSHSVKNLAFHSLRSHERWLSYQFSLSYLYIFL